MLKVARFICLALLASSLLLVVSTRAFAQTVQQNTGRYYCAKDRAGITFCQRRAPAARFSGQEGVYGDRSTGKPCKWKCKTNQGVEVCQGSGSECSGRTPPHWK